MFTLIKEPEENPTNLLESYRRQNIILQKMRALHSAFDGIKLNRFQDDDRELPDILAGSICEFEGRLFETLQTIKLQDYEDDTNHNLRYIKLVIHRDEKTSDRDYLTAEIAHGYNATNDNFPDYDYERRGFYISENNKAIEKYLRLSMKYDSNLGGYIEKKYWNINDFQRKGVVLKQKTVSFKAGEYEFELPDDANSLTIHLCSAGAGGYYGLSNGQGKELPTNGGDSKIIINGKTITTCKGGNIPALEGLTFTGGIGGKANGEGKLINGQNGSITQYNNININTGAVFSNNITLASGGHGGNGSIKGVRSAGGGSGSAAITTVTRSMLEGQNKIKIVVGKGGAGGIGQYADYAGENGADGSAVIEYMTKD